MSHVVPPPQTGTAKWSIWMPRPRPPRRGKPRARRQAIYNEWVTDMVEQLNGRGFSLLAEESGGRTSPSPPRRFTYRLQKDPDLSIKYLGERSVAKGEEVQFDVGSERRIKRVTDDIFNRIFEEYEGHLPRHGPIASRNAAVERLGEELGGYYGRHLGAWELVPEPYRPPHHYWAAKGEFPRTYEEQGWGKQETPKGTRADPRYQDLEAEFPGFKGGDYSLRKSFFDPQGNLFGEGGEGAVFKSTFKPYEHHAGWPREDPALVNPRQLNLPFSHTGKQMELRFDDVNIDKVLRGAFEDPAMEIELQTMLTPAERARLERVRRERGEEGGLSPGP